MFTTLLPTSLRVCVAALLTLTPLISVSCFAADTATTNDNVVVLVSIDGLAAFHLDDPKINIPTLRKLAADGAVAKRMKPSLPTLTWPNHTTLVTGVTPGRHGVLGNNYWDRKEAKSIRLIPDPIFNKDEIVKVPTIYDVCHAAGLKTAGINWPASRGAKTLDWTTPDVHDQDVYEKYSTPSLFNEAKAMGLPITKHEELCNDKHGGRERDIMYTKMLIHVIKEHRPNIAIIHLVEVDHVEHAGGPRSQETYDAIAFEDERIKEIQEALEKNFPGKATLIVTSDHGFCEVRQQIQPNVKFRQENLLKAAAGKITDRTVFALAQGGSSFIYILDSAQRADLSKRVVSMFEKVEGIDQVIRTEDLKKAGLDTPDVDPHMPDLVLTAKDGYTFTDNAMGDVLVTPVAANTTGSHGHAPTQPSIYASFIAWGRGVKKGAKLGDINNLDVAPTAAAFLGIEMKNVDGRVLNEIMHK